MSPAPDAMMPVVSKHRPDGRPEHWDVTFPCCEAGGVVNFPTEAAACAHAEKHKCVAGQDMSEEAAPSAAPVLDLAAVKQRLIYAKVTGGGAGWRRDDVPNLIAAIERVSAVAAELRAGNPNGIMSQKRAADLITSALNLKDN